MSRHAKVLIIFTLLSFLMFFALFQNASLSILFQSDVDDAFSFSLENGFYEDDIQIELSLSNPYMNRMNIYYTLDGSTPDTSSLLYKEPLLYQASDKVEIVTIRAVVCDKSGLTIGGPYTATYFVGKNIAAWSNALVVSITSDADGLYSEQDGILYPMADCGETEEDWKWFEQQNCKQRGDDWIRDAHMDIFEPDGSNVVSQDIGLCVDGDHGSMIHYPYSLKVLADKEYDSLHPTFQYDFFRYYNTRGTVFPHIQEYNNLVFRNGGNEYNAGAADPEQKGTMLRWNIGSRLADEAGYMTASARPAIIFLNGELYSVAQLQDTYNRFNTGSKTLLNKNKLEIYKDGERNCTISGGYEDLYYSYPDIESSPILQKENQEALEQTVSLDDMLAYYAFEVLVNNTDYPKKNYAIWRYTGEDEGQTWADGKFRFLINDLDCTWDFRYDDDLWVAYFHNIKEDGVLMGSLVQVEEYKARFLNILCDEMNSGLFDADHLETVINEANNDFALIASYFYSEEDEAKRQQNVQLLKESAFARKEKVRGFIQETFAPQYPYTLSVKAPAEGAVIRFSTTELTASDGDFCGFYYGDYPMTLSAQYNDSTEFTCWKINGRKIVSPEVTLDASLIQSGGITVELVTSPQPDTDGLLISEIQTGKADAGEAWIELYNASGHDIDLHEYSLTNDILRAFKFRLPDTMLSPGETFVAGVSGNGRFQLNSGLQVYLTKEKTVADSCAVPMMAASESYGRFGETDEWRYYTQPTKGAAN